MNAHNLNQSGSRVEDKWLSPGDRVYFSKPPTQQEVARRGRKAKHLAHYHGPAIVQSQVQGRDRQYNIGFLRKTWFIRSGTNAGKGTLNAPFPKSPHLRLWTGKLPTNEFNDLILATGIRLDANGYLTKESLKIASQVAIPHEAINTIEDEKEIQAQLQISNAM
jgi:hypothetical protein